MFNLAINPSEMQHFLQIYKEICKFLKNNFFYFLLKNTLGDSSVLWIITILNFNRALENLRALNDFSFTDFFQRQSDGMLHGRRQLLLSQSDFKQVLSEDFTDKFHQYLRQFASAFHFCSLSTDRGLWKMCSTKGDGYWSQFKTAIFRKSY